jgi:calcium permeable stress-gated cation channel
MNGAMDGSQQCPTYNSMLLVCSIRIFSITPLVCLFGVLPVNYHGKEMSNTHIPADALNVFTIANVKEGSPK